MQRRTFLAVTGVSSTMASGAAPAAPALYVLEQYFLKNGTQGARIAAFLQGGRMEAAARLRVAGPRIVLQALVAPHLPQVAVVTAYGSMEEMRAGRAALAADAKYRAALAQWEAGDEAPYESYAESLLEATPYAPALVDPVDRKSVV